MRKTTAHDRLQRKPPCKGKLPRIGPLPGCGNECPDYLGERCPIMEASIEVAGQQPYDPDR